MRILTRLFVGFSFTATLVVCPLPARAAAPRSPASPDGLWRDVDERAIAASAASRQIVPRVYRTVALDLPEMRQRLLRAPREFTSAARVAGEIVTLPLPDGSFQRFRVLESPIMEPALAARFPEIRTYVAQGVDDRAASCRLDVTPFGFHAQILSPAERVFIDPYRRGDTRNYIVYAARQAVRAEGIRCFFSDVNGPDPVPLPTAVSPGRVGPLTPSGDTLRTYRLALACTGEYAIYHGGTVPLALAAMTTAMNRVNGVYETEVAIRMVFIVNETDIIYLDPATDPYTNDDGVLMLSENQANLDAVIGTAGYDVGHVFSTGGGGVANLNGPCNASSKARGVTGLTDPIGDPFYIDYVAHEMGHQFGARHSFNGTTGACGGGNRSAISAYEPGSGSTIMAYAGICGAENLQPNSDAYFHTRSFDEIVAFSRGAGNVCAAPTATGNSIPVVNAGASSTIPKGTPFTLTGSATDADGDPLTYCWEEFDLGAAAPPNNDVAAARPIFRSFNPPTSPSRTFPRLADILSGTPTFGESLSTRTRTMTFRLTARDGRAGGGGVDYAQTTVSIAGAAGPFLITAPSTGAVWNGGSTQSVNWNVAASDVAPVNCANVRLSLSVDGGNTFPTTLVASTPNNGTRSLLVPTGFSSAQARVRAECVGNIFFDISHGNFTINPTPVELMRLDVD